VITRREIWTFGLIAPPFAISILLFVGPLLYLLYVSLHGTSSSELYGTEWTLSNYAQVVSDPFYLVIIRRTLGTAAIILLLSLLIGYPVAYRIARMPVRRRTIAMLLLLFPLMVSNVVRAYGWVAILGRRGAINSTLRDAGIIDVPMTMLFTPDAVVVGLLTILLPYMVISITNALVNLDPRYEEAAQALGAGPIRTFLHVTLPLSSPGVASGLLLVFLLTLSAYVTIAVLGGPQSKLLVSLVYDSVVSFQWPMAAALAFTLLLIALTVSGLIMAVLRPGRVQAGRR
jgi:putative spermidine/putrescine transport system permease protein